MCSPIYSCAPVTMLLYYDEVHWKIVWWGEHLGLLKHENTINRWEGWTLYPKDNVVTGPLVSAVENQCPSRQKPPSVKCLFQPYSSQ